MGKTQNVSAFEQDMVVGARRTGLCQELQCCWVSRVYQEWSTTQRTSSQLDTLESTWASIPVGRFQHLVESMPRRFGKQGVPNVCYT
jgi:hypothetical protein